MVYKSPNKLISGPKVIESIRDICELNIINWHRLNGVWSNPYDAMETINSWFSGLVTVTVVEMLDWKKVPKCERPIEPIGWTHIGSHEEVAQDYWNWFNAVHPDCSLEFSDAPDFGGTIDTNVFRGDIGQVSASTFAECQKMMRKGDLWISLLGDGRRHVIIEAMVSLSQLWGDMFTLSSRCRG